MMNEKTPIKISLSTFFLVLAIIVIIVMGYFTFNLYTENQNSKEELNSLNDEIDSLKNSINDYQSKIDTISNTLNSNTNATTTTENSSNNSSDSKYSKITKTLENNDILLLTDTIKNTDNTYTLKGKIITIDTSREPIAEYPFYKETGEYKQITVSAETKCEYSLDSYDYKTDTVENVFSQKLYFAGGQGACFNFSFENGKCVLVREVVTGH